MKAYLSLARPGGHPRRDHREAKKNEVEFASTVAARFARDRVDWRKWLALALLWTCPVRSEPEAGLRQSRQLVLIGAGSRRRSVR
jgi:hypothetical protein